MSGQINQNRGETNKTEIRGIFGEVMISDDELAMVKIYLHVNEDSDVIYAIIEKFKNWINVIGVGLTFDDAFRDAKWRADEFDDMGTIQRVETLEREFYNRVYERGRDDE